MEERITNLIKEKFGKDVIVTENEVTKNNGIVRNAFTIKEIGSTLAPTIYYDKDMTEDEIIDHIIEAYGNSLNEQPDFVDPAEFMQKEYVLNHVFPVLVNNEKNEEFLKTVPHHPYLADLSIIFKIDVLGGHITLKNGHLDNIGITEEELYDAAIKNVQGTGSISSISDFIPVPVEIEESPMLIASNSSKSFGASVLLDESVMDKLREIGVAAIIPSSIHEVIIVPEKFLQQGFEKELTSMIKSVNANQVNPEDFLSDNLFLFNGSEIEKVEVA